MERNEDLNRIQILYCSPDYYLNSDILFYVYQRFMFTNRCTYLLVLENIKIYIKIHIKMLLHVSVYDHH
jgi:hypothetical protein